jgi:hypothetical protein
LGQVQNYSHTTTAGTHYYWVRAYASDNTPASLTGPVSVVVT